MQRTERFLLGWLIVRSAFAVDPPDPYQAAGALMEASVARQKESVRRQVAAVPAAPGTDWFTVPWSGSGPEAEPESGGEDCPPVPPHELQDYIEEIARREGVTPDLLRAVIDRESGFRPCAVSAKGAQGLMQLMPETAAELGVNDPFDPKENIAAGARFLSRLLERYRGNITLALGAYNAGPTRVDRFQGLPPIPETLNYVADILERLKGGDP